MANTELFKLRLPTHISDASGDPESQELVAATATATGTPDGNSGYVSTMNISTVRLFFDYVGTVTTAAAVLWLLQDGTWSKVANLELEPGTNEAGDFMLIGKYSRFAVQITEVSGGGTVAVRALGVW